MRVEADISIEEREKVKAWADRQGYTMPRAYGELLSKAIDEEIMVLIT